MNGAVVNYLELTQKIVLMYREGDLLKISMID